MSARMDPTQFGNRKHLGIAHYLIRMLHRTLTETDNNSRGEINAILCVFINWKQAYSRQSHILGVKYFIENGVRPNLIPLLISYFQSREIRIKWRGKFPKLRNSNSHSFLWSKPNTLQQRKQHVAFQFSLDSRRL